MQSKETNSISWFVILVGIIRLMIPLAHAEEANVPEIKVLVCPEGCGALVSYQYMSELIEKEHPTGIQKQQAVLHQEMTYREGLTDPRKFPPAKRSTTINHCSVTQGPTAFGERNAP